MIFYKNRAIKYTDVTVLSSQEATLGNGNILLVLEKSVVLSVCCKLLDVNQVQAGWSK